MSLSIFFIDDPRQRRPSRSGMTHLVATGAIRVPSERVRNISLSLEFERQPMKKLE